MKRRIDFRVGLLTTLLVGTCCLLAGACTEPAGTVAEDAHSEIIGLEYEPPVPGSYSLPAIQAAAVRMPE